MGRLTEAQWRALRAVETDEQNRHFMVSWIALRDRGLVYWPGPYIEGRPLLTPAGRAALEKEERGE